MTRQILWLDSDSTRPSHDSTRKKFRWLWLDSDSMGLWLDKYDSSTSLPCRRAKISLIMILDSRLLFISSVFQLSSYVNCHPISDDHYPVCRLDRIERLQPDTDIQKLLSNRNRIRIRIFETLLSIFRRFKLLGKVAQSFILYLESSEAAFQTWSHDDCKSYLCCNLSAVV